jgi:hypothetical protein
MLETHTHNTASRIGTLLESPALGFVKNGIHPKATSRVGTLPKSPFLGFAQKGTIK